MTLKKPLRAADIATRRLSDEETVVLSPTGTAVIVNEVGAVLLELCDGKRTLDDLVALLCDTLRDVTEERARADVNAFVASLADAGCLVEAA